MILSEELANNWMRVCCRLTQPQLEIVDLGLEDRASRMPSSDSSRYHWHERRVLDGVVQY